MQLTFKLACLLLALLCFAIAAITARFVQPVGWLTTGGIAAGLFLLTLAEVFA
jgi:hypothetical protein